MGVIKDGSISGVLPSTETFAVHYPGYPSSTARAVETLGGTEGILKARSLQSNKLELYFRPEDPYSHPTFGELIPCNNFLLKISRRKDRDGQNADDFNRIPKSLSSNAINHEKQMCHYEVEETGEQVSQPESGLIAAPAESEAHVPEDKEQDLHADIIARVSDAYHFNGMVDYQHVLAVHADAARKRKRNWADMEPQFEKSGLIDVDLEDLMILVPQLFSPKDLPEKIVLKPSGTLSSKKKQEGVVQNRWENDYLCYNDAHYCYYQQFSNELGLEIPKKINLENFISQDSDQWEWQMAVCKLFDEHPIWIKNSLTQRLLDKGLKFGDHMLRRLLFRTAYYFSNGPFLRFWIKKGYDPRRDPESRIYQRIDFRVPPSLRSYCDANMAAGLKHRWEDICGFRVFPYKCQISLQLFELEDDYIQQEIRKPSNQATCTCATGWFSSRVLDSLRLCVATRFLSVYPKAGAEALLKFAIERFEKSKKMKICIKDSKADEEGQQQVNKELAGNEDREDSNDEDEIEEEEEEIEDDNVEEEFDAYEALDLAGEDGSLFPQHIDHENFSKNYLQELFGSFPSSETGGSKLQDADNSDGEFQIYEQYSNGDCSDDDD